MALVSSVLWKSLSVFILDTAARGCSRGQGRCCNFVNWERLFRGWKGYSTMSKYFMSHVCWFLINQICCRMGGHLFIMHRMEVTRTWSLHCWIKMLQLMRRIMYVRDLDIIAMQNRYHVIVWNYLFIYRDYDIMMTICITKYCALQIVYLLIYVLQLILQCLYLYRMDWLLCILPPTRVAT